MRFFKLLVLVLLIGAGAVLGYAYFGDMSPPSREVTQPLPGLAASPQGSAPEAGSGN